MIIVIILLVGALCLISGWAARQMQADRENTATIEEQRAEIEHLKNVNAAPSENMALENQYLKNENEALRHKVMDHETSLEMVLSELDTSA